MTTNSSSVYDIITIPASRCIVKYSMFLLWDAFAVYTYINLMDLLTIIKLSTRIGLCCVVNFVSSCFVLNLLNDLLNLYKYLLVRSLLHAVFWVPFSEFSFF